MSKNFKKGDKFILEIGDRQLDEFEIVGTDYYIRISLLEKLTPYKPSETNSNKKNTKDEILKKYYDENYDSIIGYMYGGPGKSNEIIHIDKSELRLGKDCFIFEWGWPGPDATIYRFEDYGKTWAYTDEEMIGIRG